MSFKLIKAKSLHGVVLNGYERALGFVTVFSGYVFEALCGRTHSRSATPWPFEFELVLP